MLPTMFLFTLPVLAVCAWYMAMESRRQPAAGTDSGSFWKMIPVTLPLALLGAVGFVASTVLFSFVFSGDSPYVLWFGNLRLPLPAMALTALIAYLTILPVRALAKHWALGKKSRVITAGMMTAFYAVILLFIGVFVERNLM